MKIRFATDILRRLGEELNPSLDRGILELVKNAYDADAIHCTVDLIGTDQPGGKLRVTDDGAGMSPAEIENGWLVLGRSSKSQSQRTRLGRIPAGSKGLGRLAALRMGEQVLLTTRPIHESRFEFNLLIDWPAYENVGLVDDVNLDLAQGHRAKDSQSGTEIVIESLRTKIGRREVKHLAREMILLAGPFGDDPTGFKPVLRASEFQDLEKLVSQKYFDEADYHLVAEVDERGCGKAKVVDHRSAVLFSGEHADLAPTPQRQLYHCPRTKFEFWTFLLTKDRFGARSIPVGYIREWLEQFGGVHIYQNGLRVTPYGDPGNDWLDLNLRRVQSPEERPSTNNSIGRVAFEDTGLLLVQKTDRSGFIETETFAEIRDFCKDALDWMARRRLEIAQKRREQQKVEARQHAEKTRRQLDAAVEKLPAPTREPVKRAVEHAWHAVSKQFEQYEYDVQLYRTLSTAGITSATFAHESAGNPIKVIKQSAIAIQRRAKTHAPKVYEEQLEKPVATVLRAVDSLSVLGDATLRLLDHEKRRPARVDVHRVIENVLETFRPFLDAREIGVEKQFCEGTPYLRASEAALESILTNFINNSVAAFERSSSRTRRVLISTQAADGMLLWRVADSGPGIEGIGKREIWLPGRTTRRNGTGLGLTIVRDTVKDLSGNVSVVEHGELGGAEFLVRLPILGV